MHRHTLSVLTALLLSSGASASTSVPNEKPLEARVAAAKAVIDQRMEQNRQGPAVEENLQKLAGYGHHHHRWHDWNDWRNYRRRHHHHHDDD